MIKKTLPLFTLLAAVTLSASSQMKPASKYDAHQLFAPLFYTRNGNAFRGADGAPGPGYWQNRADYQVAVKFDTAAKFISGEVKITYTNNSPDKLPFVWLELDQNIDQGDSRANTMRGPGAERKDAGFHIQKVEILENGKAAKADYL
ncbi:MAG TPA: M1 family peptidase, partial [Chitinophagaceae bacterium]